MTQREIGRLACKVMAVYFLVQTLNPLQWATSQLSGVLASISIGGPWGWNQFWTYLPTLIFPILQILVAIWLWRRAGVVAAWMTGHDLQDEQDEPDASSMPADLDAVHAVVLSSLGVWMLLQVIPPIGSEACNLVIGMVIASKQAFETAGKAVSNNLWVWGIQFGLGLWLVFGAPGIVQMLRRFHGCEQMRRPTSP
jgi:hypothetical protein